MNQVLTTVFLKIVLWFAIQCELVKRCKHFRESWHHVQVQAVLEVLDPEYKDAAVLGNSVTTKTDLSIFILWTSFHFSSTSVAQDIVMFGNYTEDCAIWLYYCSWLRQFTTTWKVINSIWGHIFFNLIFPSALWPWGPLSLYQKCVPRILPGGKGSGCKRLKTLPPSCANCLEILGTPNSWSHKGLYTDSVTITLVEKIIRYQTQWLWWWAIRRARFPCLVLTLCNKCQIVIVKS